MQWGAQDGVEEREGDAGAGTVQQQQSQAGLVDIARTHSRTASRLSSRLWVGWSVGCVDSAVESSRDA